MSRNDPTCHNCGEPAFGGGSLPVADDGRYVAVGDHVTEWAGAGGCAECVKMHAAAGDRCNEVLECYRQCTEALGWRLERAREVLGKMSSSIDETLREITS